jgi:thiol-disulfide isomerase/thioredoxin
MNFNRCAAIAATLLFAAQILSAQASESSITDQLKKLRSLSAAQRPIATIKVAQDIGTIPPGLTKVRLADTASHLVTEGDQGSDALQAVADTLAKALAEFPIPAKGDAPPMPYLDLARLVRYEHVSVKLDDPLFVKAGQLLADQDAEIGKADFTLKDLKGKKYTLSELRGKIVLVNFWATWCGPCRLEMPDLDRIYTHFEPQGLLVLSITDEEAFKVNSFISPTGYHPPVLIDAGGAVHKQFHIDGIPKTFLFNRDGKLIGETIDQTTGQQFLRLLAKTDLHN